MYQELVIVGNLGSDPELRYTPSGSAVASFSVAVNRKWTNQATGELNEETTWYRVSAWNKQAETCNQYLSKGNLVMVKGILTIDRETGGPRIWMAQDGQPRANFEVRAFNVLFLNTRQGGSGQGYQYDDSHIAEGGNGSGSASGTKAPAEVIEEDEIPF